MENASRALMIAASVILGVALLSVMIYIFRQGARVSQTYDQKQITNQLELYNSKFEKYDRDNNSIMDIISLANLAFDVNKDSNFSPSNAVQIEIVIAGKLYKLPNTNAISERNFILDNSGTKMPIYNLVNLPLEKLGITPSTIKECGAKGNTEDKLTTTKLVDGKTIYKFLFKVENPNDIEYHSENLKISRMKLTAYCNSEW